MDRALQDTMQCSWVDMDIIEYYVKLHNNSVFHQRLQDEDGEAESAILLSMPYMPTWVLQQPGWDWW